MNSVQLPWRRGVMFREVAKSLTDSIDEITRRWVEDLRQNTRTQVHKELLSAEIVDGVKGMLANLAHAIEAHEMPDGEALPIPMIGGEGELPPLGPVQRLKTTRPLLGPFEQAQTAAAALGKLRHKQGYEIEEVV